MQFNNTENYITTEDLEMAVNAAINLEKPLLIKGEPGTGKTELAKQVEILQREKVITEATSDLASTQASKLSSLVEEAEFVDVETFAAKVATIKEGFFKDSLRIP